MPGIVSDVKLFFRGERNYVKAAEQLEFALKAIQGVHGLNGLSDIFVHRYKQLDELNTKIEDLTKENVELEDLVTNSATLNEELSAIAAYSLWYDYYYGTGAYDSNDIASFNSQLGSLITATGDAYSQAAFNIYYEADNEFNEVVDSLPEDNIWTIAQYESWFDAGQSRKEALGQIGGHLLNKIEAIPWF